MIKTPLKLIGCGIALLIFGAACLSAVEEKQPIPLEERNPNIPCQNLDALDNLKEVLHWEIINDTLHIYTAKDSIRDEIKRWEYIRSLENDSLWE
jgi:hypothetical protein|tara:strand:+ start:563 stop:847 length:285 start_codon:yes stop_codon:yes gene_type:complete